MYAGQGSKSARLHVAASANNDGMDLPMPGHSSPEILAARAEPGPTRDHLPPVPVELLLPNAGDQPREPQPLRTAGCEPALTARHSRVARRAAAPAAQSEVAAAHG